MQVLIHACPGRMWYVREFLLPSLEAQGADAVEIWNDAERKGNLLSCMESFASRASDGGTWHIQDDVLLARDFVRRCRELDRGVVYGFTCGQFGDDPQQTGEVYAPDAWHSFQCIRIPDAWARECSDWFFSGAWQESPNPELYALHAMGQGDDTFFREFVQARHGRETMLNAMPNLVEHVDWLVGGSILSPYRGFLARAHYWDDEDLVAALRTRLRARCPN